MQIPVLTHGGNKEAEMDVPTIAFTPPFDKARMTPMPDAAATTDPAMRPLTAIIIKTQHYHD